MSQMDLIAPITSPNPGFTVGAGLVPALGSMPSPDWAVKGTGGHKGRPYRGNDRIQMHCAALDLAK